MTTIEKIIENLYSLKYWESEGNPIVHKILSDTIKALESEVRECETCIHSDAGKCAFTEECHSCMWENQHESTKKSVSIDKLKEIIEEMEKLKEQEEKGILYYFPPMYSARCIELLKGAIE